MKNSSIICRWLSPLLCLTLLSTGLMIPAQAQNKDRVIIVNADQPNVWTLEQAHYLLAQLHRRDLDLKTKSLEDLDPNTINGLRFDVLRTLVELGANFNQANAFTNKLLENNKTFDAERRTQLIADRKKLRDDSLQLTRDISDLQTRKAAATTQAEKDQFDAQIAAKTTLQAKVDKEVEFDDNELKTVGGASGEFKSTDATVQFDKSKLPDSLFDDALKTTAKSLIERFNQSPTLNASMMLDNVLQLQYEIVAKQLTQLRDEVGPGERLLFLELPQSINVAHREADKKWAQSWWRIAGYTRREVNKAADGSQQHSAESRTGRDKPGTAKDSETQTPTTKPATGNRAPITTAEDYDSIVNPGQSSPYKNSRLMEESAAGLESSTEFSSVFVDLEDTTPLKSVRDTLSRHKATLSNRLVRSVELIPRQSSVNVNDLKLRTKSGAFTFVASFLFGFGTRLNVQRQREQFSQFVQQELYSSAFGKGSREFGWTFTPMPGTDRLLSGDRTTYAAVVVPNDATSLLLEANGCYFPRTAYQPLDFADTTGERWTISNGTSRNCGSAQAFVVPIPNGGIGGSNDFWVKRISYQPVAKGKRIVVLISGANFSSQIGVLVNGIPLTQAIGLAQPLIRDDSKAGTGAFEELKNEKVRGRIERVDANKIVFSFQVDDFVGTPTITLIAPGKAIDINWLENVGINGDDLATLSENPSEHVVCGTPKTADCIVKAAWMFGERTTPTDFEIDSVEVFRRRAGSLSALIHGAGFDSAPAKSSLFVNGVENNKWGVVSRELIQVSEIEPLSDDTVQITLVYDNKTAKSESVANPGVLKISKISIVTYEPATATKPGLLIVRIEGGRFPSVLETDDPQRIKVTVTSSTEAFLTIKDPTEAEVVTLKDPLTNISVKVLITPKQK